MKKVTLNILSNAIKVVAEDNVEVFEDDGVLKGLGNHIEVCDSKDDVGNGIKICLVKNLCCLILDKEIDRNTGYKRFEWSWTHADDGKPCHKFDELHFVNCYFNVESNAVRVEFMSGGSGSSGKFQFVKCRLVSETKGELPYPLQVRFASNSKVKFTECNFSELQVNANDFNNNSIDCIFSNNNFVKLLLYGKTSELRFSCSNQIRDLEIGGIGESNIYFSPFERIAETPVDIQRIRNLLVKLRDSAHKKNDTEQEAILTGFLSDVVYMIRKEEKPWSQDRIAMFCRKELSNFGRSWLRPLGLLVGGHLVFCMIPFWCWSWDVYGNYLEFVTSPFSVTLNYAKCLKDIVGEIEFAKIGPVWANLIGILRNTWVAICAIAFGNALRRHKLK